METIKTLVKKTKNGYSDYAQDYECLLSVGYSRNEVKRAFEKALKFHF